MQPAPRPHPFAATRPRSNARRHAFHALLVLLALLLGSPHLTGFDGHGAKRLRTTTSAAAATLATPPPRPEPLTFEPIAPDDARLLNARTPFAADTGAIAPAFLLKGETMSRLRAVDCLASAMWYEAGNSDEGQRAVAQVVLNRVRHPAFPSSVCGVVFQGSERATGCQFTFACDGALEARQPGPRDLALARIRAETMLNGGVVPQVGLATHYHTDWVHPAWSSAMDKLARVETHLFFRWDGAWGRLPAFRQAYAGTEPEIARLATISVAHRSLADAALLAQEASAPGVVADAASAAPSAAGLGKGARPQTIVMMPGGDGDRQSYQALGKCSGQAACKVFGYVEGHADKLAFVYVRDRRAQWIEVMLWDCTAFPRAKADECLSPATQKWVDYQV
jgi:spore germination cell wall hydrolase CwlJ-like protein